MRRVRKCYKISWDQPGTLMDQLIESMLAIRARFAPENFTGLICDRGAVPADRLTVRLHGQLLQVCRETVQILVIRKYCMRCCTEEVHIPYVHEAEKRYNVLFQRGAGEIFVNRVEPLEEVLKIIRTEDYSKRGTYRRID